VGLFDRIQDLFSRLSAYAPWEVLVELLIIWIVVYAIIRFLQGTRAARAIKGLIFVLIIGTLIVRVLGDDTLARLTYLYDRVLAGFALALVVIFQPELRRALIRLGETRFFSTTEQGAAAIAAQLAPACVFLSKAQFGAIIVIERRVGLKSVTEGGTDLDAKLSSSLIQTIFHPGSALHDLAVVIRSDRVHSAGVQLPMASATEITDQSFGSRHRAAIGVTKDSDALVLVVSEETGHIRVAQRGQLSDPIERDQLEDVLRDLLGHPDDAEPASAFADSKADDPDAGFVEEVTKPAPTGTISESTPNSSPPTKGDDDQREAS
jgi:diadenylate cyclase